MGVLALRCTGRAAGGQPTYPLLLVVLCRFVVFHFFLLRSLRIHLYRKDETITVTKDETVTVKRRNGNRYQRNGNRCNRQILRDAIFVLMCNCPCRDGEKIIFGSFLFRDDCYTLLQRLVQVSTSISRLSGVPSLASSIGPPSPSSVRGGDFTTGGDFLPSGKTFIAGGDYVDNADDEGGVYPDDAFPEEPSERAPGVSIPRPLATPLNPDRGLKLETILEAVLPCTTAQVSMLFECPHFDDWGD